MKKWIAAGFIILFLISTAGVSPAQAVSTTENRIATGVLKGVRVTTEGNRESVEIFASGYADYSIMRLSNPERIVVDVFNAAAPGKQQITQVSGNWIKQVRYAQFDTYTARVVLDMTGQAEYGIEKTQSGLLLYIEGNTPMTGPDTEPSESPEPTAGPGPTPTPAVTPTPGPVVNPGTKKRITVNKSFLIDYAPSGETDGLSIRLKNYKNYKITRLTGPDRLVIDIPKVAALSSAKSVTVHGAFVQAVRYSKYGKDTARIVLDLNSQAHYTVRENSGKLLISVERPAYRNFLYSNNGDRVYFLLPGAKLTRGDELLKTLYTEERDESGKIVTFTFPAELANLGEGIFQVHDEYLDRVEIRNQPDAGTGSITFHAREKLEYLVFTREGYKTTAITLLKPVAKGEKLVVIDAGHGGSMPGAIYRGVYEKTLNLDIAGRLNRLLENKKVKTFMIREDDSYVANYERAYIANKLNASLFLSIHNNAMDATSFRGTMTLYFPGGGASSGLSGREFARIIQSNLLKRLGTVDRKSVERPDLIVLRATAMPAALAEIAYMTNRYDRANLLRESFRQKAAQGLCDSVVQALQKMK